jgi:prepilin-type N-terminal cleavage/methylation domain-containing protein
MILLSDKAVARAGFTLFEALISLAILSLVLAIVALAIRPPSPAIRAQSDAAQLTRDAIERRAEAVDKQKLISWYPDVPLCDDEVSEVFQFFPDGTASGPDICLLNIRLALHPLAGIFVEIAP